VREMSGGTDADDTSAAIVLPPRFAASIRAVAQYFGWRDARIVWFTTQVVLGAMPHAIAVADAVRRASATLSKMESSVSGRQPDQEGGPGLPGVGAPPQQSHADAAGASILKGATTHSSGSGMPSHAQRRLSGEAIAAAATGNRPATLLGAPTQGAGLYFLVPVLIHLNIAAALETRPELDGAGFVAALLLRLAAHAGLVAADPILECLTRVESAAATDDPEVRRWAVAVRRWCWRTTRLSARAIIRRPGLVWLTRTDLDVTLPLGDADVRIRRRGLDIDPGWVAWLGAFGTVVRFHYRDPP
jgi:hypothetical protein